MTVALQKIPQYLQCPILYTPCFLWPKQKIPLPPPDDKSVRSLTMSYMHLLLKAASHIALLLPSHTNNENQKREAEIICKTVFSDHPQFIRQTREAAFKTLSDPKFCGKMKVMIGLWLGHVSYIVCFTSAGG